MAQQWCGTCKHWNVVEQMELPLIGSCDAPIPLSAIINNDRMMMLETEGAECPCHQPKAADKTQ